MHPGEGSGIKGATETMDETAGGVGVAPARLVGTATMLLLATWLLAVLVEPPSAAALWLSLPAPNGTMCIWEDLHAGVLTLAEYTVAYESKSDVTPTVSVKATSPSENTLHHRENITTGQFGFTASEQGTYKLCFTLDNTENKSIRAGVNIDWKIGFAARDWEAIAKKENIEGVELGLRKVAAFAKLIHKHMLYLVGKGEKMEDDSEKANSRVALFSLMSVAVCILASALQLRHLNEYFHKKKLI